MTNSPFCVSVPATVVTGCAGTGKTEWLVKRAAQLIEQGVPASDIAFFAATKAACDTVKAELAAACGNAASAITVTTPLEYEISLLGTPEAMAFTGRRARVLLKYEESVLLQDLKLTGVHPGRLGKMLKFFERSWCDLEVMDSSWFYSDEEENVYSALVRQLRYLNAFHVNEVSRVAHSFLLKVREFGFCDAGFAHVFVDDYQLLSKASQCVAGLLAKESLAIAGDKVATVRALEEFPYAQGLDDFAAANECEVIALVESHHAEEVVTNVNAILGDEVLAVDALDIASDAPAGTFALRAHNRPLDEINGVAAEIIGLIGQGVAAEDIAVATPSKLWMRYLVKGLTRAGVNIAAAKTNVIGGDLQDDKANQLARMSAILKIVADPTDQLALRSWCAFGQYLGNSGVFDAIAKNGIDISLDSASLAAVPEENALVKFEKDLIANALDEANLLVRNVSKLRGMALVEAIALNIGNGEVIALPAGLRAAIEALPADADAQAICEAIAACCMLPVFEGEGVRVGLVEDFVGTRPRVMMLSGMVNGFAPVRNYFDPTIIERDRRPELLAKDIKRIYAAAGKAGEMLVMNYFVESTLIDAETMKLKFARIRMRNKERVCEIHPSETIRAITGDCYHD